jgi:hypothetical protein
VGPAPPKISGLPVICFTLIDERHRPTGKSPHVSPCGLLGPARELAICGRPGESVYLHSCGEGWVPFMDTWHETVEEARRQAEFEYEGVSATWLRRWFLKHWAEEQA